MKFIIEVAIFDNHMRFFSVATFFFTTVCLNRAAEISDKRFEKYSRDQRGRDGVYFVFRPVVAPLNCPRNTFLCFCSLVFPLFLFVFPFF